MSGYENIPDEELISRMREGETGISDYLMEKYKGLVRQKARAMFLVGGDTDDLIQEGMIGLFKAVRDYQPNREASFATFARLCIDRQLYTAVASSGRQKHQPLNSYVSLSEEPPETEVFQSWTGNPEEILIDRENVRILEEEIREGLSPLENRVLECYLDGYGYGEIAEILDKPPKSIDNALQRIRGKIQKKNKK
ncbi:MAG: RNA polymerase sporulation sigma factor SigH [Clostridiales bacterium]|nr:RNA polymerase sporulation sigma factor SigH [Clostridiales bacterium]